MSQKHANIIYLLSQRMAKQLRSYLSGENAVEAVAKCDNDQLAQMLHRSTCEHVGINPDSSNRANHPWKKRGYVRNPLKG
jgi:hypothetical protein